MALVHKSGSRLMMPGHGSRALKAGLVSLKDFVVSTCQVRSCAWVDPISSTTRDSLHFILTSLITSSKLFWYNLL